MNFLSMVRSLNKKQCMVYDIVLGWSRKKIKSLSVPEKKRDRSSEVVYHW